MKKLLFILTLGIALLGYTASTAFAVNYKYKLYDPKTNKAYSAYMMTFGSDSLSRDPNCYFIALGTSYGVMGVVDTVEKKGNGLVGGKCFDGKGHIYYWKEYTPGSFYRELNEIVQERAQEGMYLHGTR